MFLDLRVKVNPDWRNDDRALDELGRAAHDAEAAATVERPPATSSSNFQFAKELSSKRLTLGVGSWGWE